MGTEAEDFQGRRAPYAPISSLEKFFERIRDRATPDRVDHKFLRKLSVAQNNEYSLLSALKFLGVLDDYGTPTTFYRNLQTTDQFKDTLWRLVQLAYKPVFDAGAETYPIDELVNFFRVSSSPSQAKNAARFFRAVCSLAGHNPWEDGPSMSETEEPSGSDTPDHADFDHQSSSPGRQQTRSSAVRNPDLLSTKAALLEKLPAAQPGWSAEQYLKICDRFVEMLRHLDTE